MNMQSGWEGVVKPRRRLIVDTDAKNEADDQYAIVHALLGLMGRDDVTVANGSVAAIPDEHSPADSDGVRLIIAESKLATAEEPLYVAFLGPLTDMASAILLDPDLVRRPV